MESGITAKVLELAGKHLGEFQIANGEVIAKECPYCHGGEHHDLRTFYIGMHNGAFKCHRGSCGKSGSFRELCNDFGEHWEGDVVPFPSSAKKKEYKLPDPNTLSQLTERAIEYFGHRGISQETLEAFNISCANNGTIIFPFFRDGKLIYCKYRNPNRIPGKSKEWAFEGGEPILFGMDNASFNKPLFITEGMIDALSLYEAGITNVASVPSGCNNLEFVTLCWDWLEKFQQIVLFGDNDQPGFEMVHTLMKRLGEDRCLIAGDYPQLVYNGKDYGRACKDANEILMCYGKEGLKQVADRCEPAPVRGILNLADVNFIDPTSIPRIMTRVPDLDTCIGGLVEGGITVFSGRRGEGKSTLSGQLALNAIQDGHTVCAYSGELSSQNFLNWIMLQATERKYLGAKQDKRSGRMFATVPMAIQERIRNWISGKFYLFDNNDAGDEDVGDAIIRVFTMCARRYGCKLFIVDNLMCITAGQEEELRAQTKFAAALKKFAVKFKVHVLLIAHPRKQKPGELFTNDSVSGSANITNVADNVINIEKPNLRVTKNREFGTTAYIECKYDPANRRIFQANTGDRVVYGWDHKDLGNLPLNAVDAFPEFNLQEALPAPTSNPF